MAANGLKTEDKGTKIVIAYAFVIMAMSFLRCLQKIKAIVRSKYYLLSKLLQNQIELKWFGENTKCTTFQRCVATALFPISSIRHRRRVYKGNWRGEKQDMMVKVSIC